MSEIVNAVSGAELDRFLRGITHVVRLSGTPEEAEAFDFIEKELKGFGYDVNRYASDALIGYPLRSTLEILGSTPTLVPSNGYSLSPSTGPEGITGELVYVGAGQPGDYVGRDVTGKIVVSDGLAMPGKAMASEQAGAIGQIHVNDQHIHEMCISPVWGTPIPETAGLLPKVPSIAVAGPDGNRIKELIQQGTVTVKLVTEPFRAWTKIPTLTADLPGSSDDDFIMFSGHVDSWHYGVMDNGTANATQMEVARLLAERKNDLRRGVRFAFWSGHSHGRYASSTWYADTFWYDLHSRCSCHVNVDSVGAKGATILDEAATMAETYVFGRQVLADIAGAKLDYRRISRSSDQSFWGHGIPTVFASLSEQPRDESATGAALAQLLGAGSKSGGLGWWWHTTEDTADKIDPAYLVRDAKVYAETMWRLCTLDRLPFEPAAAAEEMAHTLSAYHKAANGALDLSGTEALAREAATAIAALSRTQHDPTAANALTMELNHLLIPINYTRTGPFEHDLALRTDPLPGLSDTAKLGKLDQSSDDFYFLRTRLTRERNRVEHALRSAMRAVERA